MRDLFDYQLNRHCSKTQASEGYRCAVFDYQLNRHCSKTYLPRFIR